MLVFNIIKYIIISAIISDAESAEDRNSAHRKLSENVYDEVRWQFDGVNYTDIKVEMFKQHSCDGEYIRCLTFRDEDYEVCVYNIHDWGGYHLLHGFCEVDFQNCVYFKHYSTVPQPRFGKHYIAGRYRYVGDWPCPTAYNYWTMPLSRGHWSWPPFSP